MNIPMPILPTPNESSNSSTPLFREFDFEALMGVETATLSEHELREYLKVLNQRASSPHEARAAKKNESDKLQGKKPKAGALKLEGLL